MEKFIIFQVLRNPSGNGVFPAELHQILGGARQVGDGQEDQRDVPHLRPDRAQNQRRLRQVISGHRYKKWQ